jgi:hypothetical protein
MPKGVAAAMTALRLPDNTMVTIIDSARDSIRFARHCMERTEAGYSRATSSFVDVDGQPMHWHDFGDLEGPGWAANAVGGAYQLYAWGRHQSDAEMQQDALALLDHVLYDGFIKPDGFIVPYRDTATGRLCLNFKHNSDWLCPGSMARIALQMLWACDVLPKGEPRVALLQETAVRNAAWLIDHVATRDGWYTRRCTPDGIPYELAAEGGDEPMPWASADGLYIVWLLLELTQRRLGSHLDRVREGLDTIVRRSGIYGSINHDTYDRDENVARAETARLFLFASRVLNDEAMATFAIENALAGMRRFRMMEDRNGVATRGLLYMEDSWDTAYLWENAEASLAYLEAFEHTRDREFYQTGITILRAIAMHHHGPHGFLTEGVDWNDHVGRQHHIDGAKYGDIRYTEPLLNNLHHVEATLRYLAMGEGR